MITTGDIITYKEMGQEFGLCLQRKMNFKLKDICSVFLILSDSVHEFENNGTRLIFEGHDMPKDRIVDTKKVNQPKIYPSGRLTENTLFYNAANAYKNNGSDPEEIKVYRKLYSGYWLYLGLFQLIDSWITQSNNREVFKFKLHLIPEII
jgi:hypothetical protein